MKKFKFFIKKIFLRRGLLTVAVFLLLFMANYLSFLAARSIYSAWQGYEQVRVLDQGGKHIANLDPESEVDIDRITRENMQAIYQYLNANYTYGFYSDGYVIDLANDSEMDVILAYVNEEYHGLGSFQVQEGEGLDFTWKPGEEKEIPVIVGAGLKESYPLGTVIQVEDPVLERPLSFKVQGIFQRDAHRSNFYALNSKQYYNFSILVPVNQEFIAQANPDFQLNGLMDLVLAPGSEKGLGELGEYIADTIGVSFNFFSQAENLEYFNEYFFAAMKTILLLTMGLVLIITLLSLWNGLTSLGLMLKDFTLNLLVGLSYAELRKIFYGYYSLIFTVNMIILYLMTLAMRYGPWMRKEADFVTYGFLGLIGLDWFALFMVLVLDLVVGSLIVETMMWRIKKVPISLGVVQG